MGVGTLPGSVHGKKAEWTWGVLAELESAGLVTLADKGYRGSSWAKIPYRGGTSPGRVPEFRESSRSRLANRPQLSNLAGQLKFRASSASIGTP